MESSYRSECPVEVPCRSRTILIEDRVTRLRGSISALQRDITSIKTKIRAEVSKLYPGPNGTRQTKYWKELEESLIRQETVKRQPTIDRLERKLKAQTDLLSLLERRVAP